MRPGKDPEGFRTKVFAKLRRLEEEILRLRGKERTEVMETYREFLQLLIDEPIFLMRSYEQ